MVKEGGGPYASETGGAENIEHWKEKKAEDFCPGEKRRKRIEGRVLALRKQKVTKQQMDYRGRSTGRRNEKAAPKKRKRKA